MRGAYPSSSCSTTRSTSLRDATSPRPRRTVRPDWPRPGGSSRTSPPR
ncbi:hypothetical protein NKH77_18895 [Streptomyces sp. M19]